MTLLEFRRGRSMRMQWIAGLTLLICNLAIASPPTAPTNLTAVAASSTQINLSWTASTDNLQITGYVIERCSGASCTNFAQVGTVATGTAYTDSGLSAATTYRYEVYGTDSTGGGPVSNIASAETMAASVASSVTYAYDALGRLLQANVAATNIVENYTYDSAGNLTSITSSPVSTLDIANFSNPVGGPGSTITIIGSGFSTTPSSNTVKFNGITATVISATATQLVVSIPAGATTGPITVTRGSQTVTSPGTFNVIAAVGAPTIASFPPSSAPGSTIVITGTGFQTNPGDNAVRINQSPAPVVSATATSLTVVVPPSGDANLNISAGPITITTPFGTITSTTSFVTTAWPLGSIGTVSVGGPPVTVSAVAGASTGYYVELLTGTAGSNLVINDAGGAINLTFSVIAPNGATPLYNSGFGTSGGQVQIPTLPVSGTYVVLVSPGSQTGSSSFTLVGSVAKTLTLNGTPTTVTLGTPGESAVLTFAGTQGAYDSLAFSSVTLSGATALVTNPDGTTLTSLSLTTAGATLLPQLPQTGTYTVTVVPKGTLTGSFTAALTSTSAATLTVNSAPYNATLNGTTPVTVTFDAAVGQYLTLAFQSTASFYLTATVTGPNANQIVQSSQTINSTSSAGINLGPLTVAGTYSLTLQQNVSTNSMLAVTLSAPVPGAMPFNTPTNVTMGLQGQGFAETFTGSAGQYVSAAVVTSVSATPSLYGNLSLISPTGVVLVTQTITGTCNGCNEYGVASFGPLPTTGTYTILLKQSTTTPTTGSATVTLAQGVTGTLTDGTSNPVMVIAGQGFEETFTGTAGQYVSVGVSANSSTAPTAGTLSILDPYGNVIGSSTYSRSCLGSNCSGSGVVNAGPLAVSGNYTVVYQQSSSAYGVGSGAMSVTPAAAVTGSLTLGTASNLTLLAGQGFEESLAGTTGQYLSVAVTSTANIPSGTISVLTPSGSVLATGAYINPSGTSGAGSVSFGPLPSTGTYSVLFQQSDSTNVLGQGQVSVTAENTASGSLTLGTPSTVSLTNFQGVQETFNETAGDYDTVQVSESGGLIYSGTIWVISPGGTVISTQSFGYSCPSTCTGSTSFNIGPLPSTGSYTLLIEQADQGPGRGSGSLTLQVTNNPAGTGTTQNLQTTVAGQAATFTFLAAANQTFNLAFTGMAFTPNTVTSFSIAIKNSSGTTVYSNSCSSSSCSMSIPTYDIAADGTYTVSVTPNGSATMTGTATLSPTAVGELTVGTPLNLTLATDQAASLLFSATANQTLALYISGIATTPSGGSYYVTISNPTGTVIGSAVPSSATTINLPNLPAGTYTVSVSAEGTYSGTMQVTLAAGVTGTLPLTGSGINISTSTPGDTAYYTFAGTQQQGVTLAISNLTLTPSSVTTINLGLPTDDALGYPGSTCSTSGCAFHLPYLPQTQNYTVSLTPAGEATMSLTATLSQDVTGTLAAGTPLNLSLSDPGQSAVLTFVLTAPGEDNTELYISSFSNNPSTSSYTLSVYQVVESGAPGEYSQVKSVTLTSAAQAVNLSGLSPGTYLVVITPNSAAVASLQLTLYAPAGVAVPSGGSPVTVSTAGPGQNAYLTFQGNAGQYLSLPLTSFTLTPSTTTSLTARAYTPNATQVGYVNCSVPSLGCELYLANLPVTDTYNVTIVPSSSPLNTMSFSAAEPPPVTGTLALSTPTNESLSVVGQIANLSFTTTATETVTVSIGSIATTPSGNSITAFVYNSSGANVGPYYGTSGSATQPITITLTNLPAGAYSLVIYPQLPTTETMQVTVTP